MINRRNQNYPNCVSSVRRQGQRGKRIRVNDEVRYSHDTETEVRVKVKNSNWTIREKEPREG